MAKQDEKQRLQRRLQERAIGFAGANQWEEAIETNREMLELGEDPETYNRLGKAFMELGRYQESHDAYSQTLRLNPTNAIARRNLSRLDVLITRGVETEIKRNSRQQVDLRMFITETGRTALTALVEVARDPFVDALVTGEKVELRVENRTVFVIDAEGNVIGRIEPRLSQRLAELIEGGNRYLAAVSQADGRKIRILIRETYQDPSQRGRISFPGKLGEGAMYVSNLRYEEFTEDLLDDDDSGDENEVIEEDFGGDEEEELGLEEIEQDMSDEEEEE